MNARTPAIVLLRSLPHTELVSAGMFLPSVFVARPSRFGLLSSRPRENLQDEKRRSGTQGKHKLTSSPGHSDAQFIGRRSQGGRSTNGLSSCGQVIQATAKLTGDWAAVITVYTYFARPC